MVKLGEKVLLCPATFEEAGKGKPSAPRPGRVVYIHPEGRFCIVAFKADRGERIIRESFQLVKGEILT